MLERLLVVGLGSIGKRHVRLARMLLPDVEIAVLRHQNCEGPLPGEINYCVTEIDDALDFRPQAAVIANPAPHHIAVALPLVEAGVHLMIEKPLADSVQHVSELIAACETRNVVLLIGYNLRFVPSLQHFRSLLCANCVGRILSVRAEVGQYLPGWRNGVDYRQTVTAQAALGGGVLLELSHEIDYLRWLFGDVRWVSGLARHQSDLEIDVEDIAHLLLGFGESIDTEGLIASLTLDCFRHDTTRSCTVVGETGTIRWNALTCSVELYPADGQGWETLYARTSQRDDSYLAEWRHFLNCVAGTETPQITGRDGLAVLRVVEAVHQSSSQGAAIRIIRKDR